MQAAELELCLPAHHLVCAKLRDEQVLEQRELCVQLRDALALVAEHRKVRAPVRLEHHLRHAVAAADRHRAQPLAQRHLHHLLVRAHPRAQRLGAFVAVVLEDAHPRVVHDEELLHCAAAPPCVLSLPLRFLFVSLLLRFLLYNLILMLLLLLLLLLYVMMKRRKVF